MVSRQQRYNGSKRDMLHTFSMQKYSEYAYTNIALLLQRWNIFIIIIGNCVITEPSQANLHVYLILGKFQCYMCMRVYINCSRKRNFMTIVITTRIYLCPIESRYVIRVHCTFYMLLYHIIIQSKRDGERKKRACYPNPSAFISCVLSVQIQHVSDIIYCMFEIFQFECIIF